MKQMLCKLSFNLYIKWRVIRRYVSSVLYYETEVYILTDIIRRLELLELWCYRCMLRISWITLQMISENKEVFATVIYTRKLYYFEHIVRSNKYEMV